MVNNLLTPILNNRTTSVNFFNGRLLTGEDLTAEQKAARAARSLLGQAIGSGVVHGLEVTASAASTTPQNPVLSITPGLAINRNGGVLLLDNGGSSVDLALVRPASSTNGTTGSTSVFQECVPAQSGTYVAGAGVYLLTIGPASVSQGLAEVSGLNNATASCNSNYNADGVQFRLLQLNLTQAELSDTNHLQNLVAYKFFAPKDWAAPVTDPFGTAPSGFGLLDRLRSAKQITDCEVPLAVLYWTATGGLVFIDTWAVRRPVFSRDLLRAWAPGASHRRIVEGLAMFLQFQAQINNLVQQAAVSLSSISASDFFLYLPPVGLLPLAGTHTPVGFIYPQFFSNVTRSCAQKSDKLCAPFFLEGTKVNQLVYRSLLYPAINLSSQEMIWLYWVRENMQAASAQTTPATPYVMFTNGHIPYQGQAQFDLNYWGYANFV